RLKKHQGVSYYFHEDTWGALHLADDRTVLFGSEDAVIQVAQMKTRKKADAPLAKALQLAAGKTPLVVGFNPAVLPGAAVKMLPEALQPLGKAEWVSLAVDLDRSVSLRLLAGY